MAKAVRAVTESTVEIFSHVPFFHFLCQPTNIPTLMHVKHDVVQALFLFELQYSFLIIRRLQLQAVTNFVSKSSFHGTFRTDSSFRLQSIRVKKRTARARAVDKKCRERGCPPPAELKHPIMP